MGKWLQSTETIKFEVVNRVARITMNRPEKRNTLSDQLLTELNRALLEADDLREVRCVVLAGEGKDFCAGYDLGGNYQAKVQAEAAAKAAGVAVPEDPYRPQGAVPFDDDTWMLERMQDLKMIIFDMHKPVVARVHGNCLAGGTDIAVLCDMVIASNDAGWFSGDALARLAAAAHVALSLRPAMVEAPANDRRLGARQGRGKNRPRHEGRAARQAGPRGERPGPPPRQRRGRPAGGAEAHRQYRP
jgi:enoyl-CoA hydratase/carnithine racemase